MRYEKRGSVARWENGTLVLVTEEGLALEDAEGFSCMPLRADPLPALDPARVIETARRIAAVVRPPVRIERLVVSEGFAEHRIEATRWEERHERVHLALVRDRERVLLDLGAFDPADVSLVANAFAGCEEAGGNAPERVRLAPAVAAALLPSWTGVSMPGLELRQTAGGFDGRGALVVDAPISGEPYPNWYRPSYRVRPRRMPLNLRAECVAEAIDPRLPVAVALLGPPGDLQVRVLISDGSRVFPAKVQVARVEAVSPRRTWYPHGAGVFGSEMVVVNDSSPASDTRLLSLNS